MHKTSVAEFQAILTQLGLKKGDDVLIYSNVASLGMVERSLDGILEGLQHTIGPDGTLVVPTFSFSFCEGKEFDVHAPTSTCGVFTNHLIKHSDAMRSVQPIHSLAAIGPQKAKALKMTDKSSFGPGSAFTSILEMDFKVLLLGVVHNTYIHYVEQKARVEYRYDKVFSGKIKNGNEVYDDTCTYFVRKLGVDGLHTRDRAPQRQLFWESPLCKELKFAYGRHYLFKAREYCDFMLEKLSKDPLFLVDKEKYLNSLAKE